MVSILLLLIFSFSYSQSDNCKGYTLTIGGWGNENPNNPNYQLLANNFAGAFPNGLTVGCSSGYQLHFTSAAAIRDYLPAGGPSLALTTNYTNPATIDLKNTLASQLIAVKLAVGIDEYNPNYSSAVTTIGNQIFTSGIFAGMTVNQFLALADNFMGGCGNSLYSGDDFNAVATAINENFDAGINDNGYLSCCALKVTLSGNNITCFGDGTVLHANISGSSSPQIQWYKDNVLIVGANSADLAVTEGNHNYKVKVTDGNCNDSDSKYITEPAKIVFSVKPYNNACFGETRQVELQNISGGTLTGGQSYSIVWTNTSTNQQYTGNPVNLTAGFYSVVVSDSKNCHSDSVSVVIAENPKIEVNFSGNISCFGGNTNLVATATGGSGSYSNYIWKDGSGNVVQSGSSNTLQNAVAGNYSVEVIDNIGCASGSVSHQLGQPTEIMLTANAIDTACYQGTSSASVNISGGTVNSVSDYVVKWYQWSGADYNSSVFASGNPVDLPAGKYKVVVSDLNGCSKTLLDIIVSEYPKINVSISGAILCYGQTATLTATANGGTGNYVTYQWTKDGVALSNNSNTLQNAAAGVYTVKVWDSHNCTNPDEAALNLISPTYILFTVNAPDVTCYNGTSHITVNISGGTPFAAPNAPYSVTWSQNGTVVATGNPVDLSVGIYTVSIQDANGCPKTASVTVKQVTCQGTTVTLGGWGAPANGNNWGMYRDNNFASVFNANSNPPYLQIGSGSKIFKFTTALAVKNFLKSGGNPAVLPGSATNPANNKNTLANNVVALTLNVGFDLANPNFGASTTSLGDMIVTSGPMQGCTVKQVLALANQILGGTSTQYSPSAMNAIVDAINNNFDNGTTNNGYLACPCVSTPAPFAKVAPKVIREVKPIVEETQFTVYPNPTKGDINLKFTTEKEETLTVQLFNSSGKMIADLSRNVVRNGNEVTVSYYNYDLFEGLYILTVKSISIQKSFKVIVRK